MRAELGLRENWKQFSLLVVINAFVGSTAGMMALSMAAIGIFSAYMLYDIKRIIDGGEIRAEGTRRELVALIGGQDQVRLVVTGDVEAAVTAVTAVEGVTGAGAKDGELEILVADAHRVLPRLLDAVEGAGARWVHWRWPFTTSPPGWRPAAANSLLIYSTVIVSPRVAGARPS